MLKRLLYYCGGGCRLTTYIRTQTQQLHSVPLPRSQLGSDQTERPSSGSP